LTSASKGRIHLRLPAARLSGWTWGVELASGSLACELSSVELQFDLPRAPLRIRIGSAVYPLPNESTSGDGAPVKESEYEDRDEENTDTVARWILNSKPLGRRLGGRQLVWSNPFDLAVLTDQKCVLSETAAGLEFPVWV